MFLNSNYSNKNAQASDIKRSTSKSSTSFERNFNEILKTEMANNLENLFFFCENEIDDEYEKQIYFEYIKESFEYLSKF